MDNILKYLEKTAERFPDKTAVDDGTVQFTYQELLDKARHFGLSFLDKTMPGRPVAILREKSSEVLAAMFGIVYAGCFYVMIDPEQPLERLKDILSVLKTDLVLTDSTYKNQLEDAGYQGEIYLLDQERTEASLTEQDVEKLMERRSTADSTDLLYGIFTSGSTGKPKCVAVSQQAVIDFIGHFTKQFEITDQDRIANQAPFDFDVSVKDIYTGLLTGAKVQIIPREYFSDPTTLMDYMADSKMTVLTWAVSAMCFVSVMNGFDYRTPDTVRKVLFSGEVLPVKHYRVWKKYLPQAMFVNLYGPTEVTCNCTYYVLDPADKYELTDVIPIGKSFPNERVFLLDETDQEVTEAGMNGEICVSSSELALGYYNAPDKTAQVFVQNPLNHLYDERIYRTGDLAKYDAEGNLVYISRKDFQIKHLGHRIELGEIEVAANAVNGISRSCCIYEAEKERLLLFYTGECEKRQLIKLLRGALPPYMIPNMALRLAEMPMTKNGKIDRNKLMKLYEESLHARHFKK